MYTAQYNTQRHVEWRRVSASFRGAFDYAPPKKPNQSSAMSIVCGHTTKLSPKKHRKPFNFSRTTTYIDTKGRVIYQKNSFPTFFSSSLNFVFIYCFAYHPSGPLFLWMNLGLVQFRFFIFAVFSCWLPLPRTKQKNKVHLDLLELSKGLLCILADPFDRWCSIKLNGIVLRQHKIFCSPSITKLNHQIIH